MTWVAYVDESMRVPAADGPSWYILAAAVLHADDVEATREAVRWLSEGHGRRFHWRDSSPAARSKAAGVVADLSAVHMVVVGVPLDRRRQERGRRFCLERLLYELESAGVSEVSLEARTESLNKKDLIVVDAWRAQHVIGRSLRVDHDYPSTEPLLWLSDIVAGAVAAAHGGDAQWRNVFASLLSEIHVNIK
jgi:Protein of unknown function (DUF3800)